jgi:hypothetical protein
MTTSGGLAKGILLFSFGCYLYAALNLAFNDQAAISAFMLIGFIVPLSIYLYGNLKNKKQPNH